MEGLKELATSLMTEGTVRGAILTGVVALLGFAGKLGWRWLTKPCPLSPLALGAVNYLLHEDRLEDSEYWDNSRVLTPELEVRPGYLYSSTAKEDVWGSLSRSERKAVTAAHKVLLRALREKQDREARDYREEKADQAALALAPFARGRSRKLS